MKQFSIFLLLLVLTMPAIAEIAGVVTLSGYLKNKADGEALIGATVYIQELKTGLLPIPMDSIPFRWLREIIQSAFLLSVTKHNHRRLT